MNPPYSQPENACRKTCKKKACARRGHHLDARKPGQIDFVRKAKAEAAKGCKVVCLLPARTDTAIFHEFIWDNNTEAPRPGVRLRFIQGRITFAGARDPAPFPSMIVVFLPPRRGFPDDLAALKEE